MVKRLPAQKSRVPNASEELGANRHKCLVLKGPGELGQVARGSSR